MRYRVTFAKRMQPDGTPSDIDPTVELDSDIDDGVIAEKVFVERLEAPSMHSQEMQDEDDGFLASAAPETWEYEVVNDRAKEFMDAAVRARASVIRVEKVEDSQTLEEDVTRVPLAEGESEAGAASDSPEQTMRVTMKPDIAMGRGEGFGEASAEIDELSIKRRSDRGLGLTTGTEPDFGLGREYRLSGESRARYGNKRHQR
jgi:hypothetical protein